MELEFMDSGPDWDDDADEALLDDDFDAIAETEAEILRDLARNAAANR